MTNNLTVIVNFYQEKQYQVIRALDSLVLQTYKKFDTIVAIDGKDKLNIKSIVDGYHNKLDNLKVVVFDNNYGLAYIKNNIIQQINTEFIAFLDGDDEYLSDKLKLQMQAINNDSKIAVIGCSIQAIDESNHVRNFYEKFDCSNNLKYKVPVHHPTIMIKKSVFDKYGYYDNNKLTSEDYELFIRWHLQGVRFYNLEEHLYKYYRDTSGKNANLNKHLKSAFKLKLQYSNKLRYNITDYLKLFFIDGLLCIFPRQLLKHIYFIYNINICGKNVK